jgi:hypothetical protein
LPGETAGDESAGYRAAPVEDRLASRHGRRFVSQNGLSPVSPGAAKKHEPFTVVRPNPTSRLAHYPNK